MIFKPFTGLVELGVQGLHPYFLAEIKEIIYYVLQLVQLSSIIVSYTPKNFVVLYFDNLRLFFL